MISINKNIQSEILMTTMEEIVPEDSLFRKIDKYIDFTFIYDKVKGLYCENNGRPSIDPIVLFKKEKGFMYLDHRTVDDKCNIIVDAYITKGNVHDSGPFIERSEYIKKQIWI